MLWLKIKISKNEIIVIAFESYAYVSDFTSLGNIRYNHTTYFH